MSTQTQVKNLAAKALEQGSGVVRLTPTWVPRSFCVPGRRLRLHPDDLYALGANRGGLDERWFTWDGSVEIVESDGSQVLSFESPGENNWTGASPIPPIRGDYSVSLRAKIVRRQDVYGDVLVNVRLADNIGIECSIGTVGWTNIGYLVADQWTELSGSNLTIEPDTWYLMRVDIVGEDIQLYVDERLVLSATQPGLGPGETFTIATAPTGAILVDDVVIRSLDPASMDAAAQVTVIADVNMRLYPGTDQPIIGRAGSGSRVYLLDMSEDKTWVYVRQPETGVQGWISAEFITTE